MHLNLRPLLIGILSFVFVSKSGAQMRQLSLDVFDADNHIEKLSFYSPSQGYAGFTKWIGFTTDSGRTFIRKYITLSNVNYNGYFPNLTFGFGISGVKAFSQDTLIVYGDYGFVPSILYSVDQGNTFKLVYQSSYNLQQYTRGVTDMVFPENNNIGYAVEADRIIKSVDRGKTWFTIYNDLNGYYDVIQGLDNNNLWAYSTTWPSTRLAKTTNGANWQQVTIPDTKILSAYFYTPSKGWLTANGNVYYTSNSGGNWVLKNDPDASSFSSNKMKFINDSTGYALYGFDTYKTTDSGKVWQRLPRDNNYTYLNYYHYELFFWNNNQFWSGGGHGFLEISTNGGGVPYPKAQFKIDTTNLYLTNTVKLVNYSKPGYLYKWFKDGTLISSSYNATYTHVPAEVYNSIDLVVSDGTRSDTVNHFQYFDPPPPPPGPYTGWELKPTNLADNLLDVRFFGNTGVVIGENGIYYTNTGIDNTAGWNKYVINNSVSDSSLLARTKFRQLAFNGTGTLFYAIGEDTVNSKAILFRFNPSTLSYSFLYEGTQGTKLNSLLYLDAANQVFAVGNNGLYLTHAWGTGVVNQKYLPGLKNLVGIFEERDYSSHPGRFSIMADSTVYECAYDGNLNIINPVITLPLNDKYVGGCANWSDQYYGITSNHVLQNLNNFNGLRIDSIKRIKPANLVYRSIADSRNPNYVYLATNQGIYKLFPTSNPTNSTCLEYQPTSLKKDVNRIWFKEKQPYDTGYAAGRNGVLFKTVNYGGPMVPYSDIKTQGSCIGNGTPLAGTHGTGTSCKWFVDGVFVTDDCSIPYTMINTPGNHTLTYIVSNGWGLADTSTRIIYVSPAPTINLPVTVADTILCKSEKAYISIQNTEANYSYELVDSTGLSYGTVTSGGGQVQIVTSPISRTGNYHIRVSSVIGSCTKEFTQNIFLKVEHPKSRFTATKINITPSETLGFYNHSNEAQSFNWSFNQDASVSSSSLPFVQNISYASQGLKTLRLISTTANGCSDTLTATAVYVYNKPNPDDVCFAFAVDSSKLHGQGYRSFTKSGIDDSYFITGTGNGPTVRSRYGVSPHLPATEASFLAKYSTDGVVKWINYIDSSSGVITTTAMDAQGNIYVGGYANIRAQYFFANGDSVRVAAATYNPADYIYFEQGFIIKLDSNGNYLWHVTLVDPVPPNGSPAQGGKVSKIVVRNGKIIVLGDFLSVLNYYRNGIAQPLYNITTYGLYNEFVLMINSDGTLDWNARAGFGATNQIHDINDADIDGAGNIYISGWYEDSFNFYDVANTPLNLVGSFATTHSYVLKLDSAGHLKWRVKLDNNAVQSFNEIWVQDIEVDQMGNSYIIGTTDLSHIFWTWFTTTGANNSVKNFRLAPYFLLKIDSSGVVKWGAGTRANFLASSPGGAALTLDGDYIYTATRMQGATQYSLYSSDTTNINFIISDDDFFVAKYDTSGILKRVAKSGQNTTGRFVVGDLFTDSKKNIVVSGAVEANTTPVILFNNQITNSNTNDIFFAKTDSNFCTAPVYPTANAGPDKTVCSGNPTTIGVIGTGDTYSWSSFPDGFNSTLANPTVAPNVPTKYYLTVMNAAGYISRDTVFVNVNGPIADAGPAISICPGTSTTLGVAAVSGYSYSWTASQGTFTSTSANPTVSPTSTTSYYLVVTNGASSCTAKDTIVVTVFPSPPAFAGPDKAICYGSTIPASLGTSAIPGFTYSWSPSTGLTITNQAQVPAYPLSTTTYILAVTNPATGCVKTDTVIVTVTQSLTTPTVSPAGPLSICTGGSVVLTSSSTGGNQWYKDGFQISGGTGQGYMVTQAGTYKVQYTSANCKSYFSADVVVTIGGSVPAITASGPVTFCLGGNVVLNTTATGTLQWNLNGNPITGATAQNYTASTSGNYTVSTSGSCSATSNVITVTVNSIPSTPVASASGSTTICQGNSVTLNSTATSGNQWYKDGVALTGATSQTYTALIAGVYTVQSMVGGCSSASSNSITVVVNPLPPTPSISTSGPVAICQGSNVILTSSASAGIQWLKDGVAIAGATAQNYTASQAGIYKIQVTLNGCSSTSAGVTVVVNSVPSTPSITASGPLSFCQGGSVVLTSSATSGNQWRLNGNAITGATGQTYTASQTGNYSVTTTLSGCVSSPSNNLAITVNAVPPTPTISQSGNSLISSSATGNQWYLGGTPINGATSASYTPTVSGVYTVKVTTNGCSSQFSQNFSFAVTAVSTVNPDEVLIIAPNPVVGFLSVKQVGNNHNLRLVITDMTGRELIKVASFTNQITINMGSLASGSYFVKIINLRNKKQFQKLIVKL